mgnify:CR=1 FL=1
MGIRHFIQGEGAIDDHADPTGVDPLAQPVELTPTGLHDHELRLLSSGQGSKHVYDDAPARDGLDVCASWVEQVLHLVEVEEVNE